LKLHTVRSICIEAALQEESGSAMGVEGSIIKIRGSELQQAISELTMECLGGYAAVFDPADIHGEQGCSPVGPHDSAGLVREYLYGRVKTIFGGSNEIQRNIISKAALGL
jgi:alkylation response protein AidB-like acyl-CoA dehydrogenase